MADEKFLDTVKRLKLLVASGSALILVALFFALNGPARMTQLAEPQEEAKEAVREVVKIDDPMAYFREDRTQVRQEEIAQLSEIIAFDKTSEENRSAAQRQILNLTSWMEKETTIEGVLRARGFQDVLATVHTDSVNVLIRAEAVSQSESATILELVMRETGIAGGNIKIIPIN